ncbi:MAG: 30S ribosomal protein S12 methylthiotransferase RimO [Candidatus Izemoplasmatales bacterium]|nr:30S ribosomal protein S12 methylthiotransferase RimO [bacterium]MDZ4196825.1 30S ribosomal protein S12 methylthiotransferase RimO [Candidatus Izemoplasmatales bacterium]
MNVGLISLGCAKNQVDSELILGVLQNAGIHITSEIQDADAIIINTCGFIEPAKQETLDTIKEMSNTGKRIIVCGCYAQRYPNELRAAFPHIDRIITLQEYPMIDKILEETFQDKTLKFGPMSFFNRVLTTSKRSPYVKLSEGCDNRCTFCAIPLIRGRFRSRTMEEIIAECKQLIQQGAKELNLISQDTTKYGCDLTSDKTSLLPRLLEELVQLDGIEWVRILYLYPDEVSDELLQTIQKHDKIAKYFDIPIQHVSSNVLRRMARRGNQEFLVQLFSKIKTMMPSSVLRTTLIVGFPGETEADFQQLEEFIKQIRFDRLGAFAYSKETDTPAYDFIDQIDESIKESRLNKILTLQQKIAKAKNKERIGSIQRTLVEQYDPKSKFYYGRSEAFAPDDIDGFIVFQSKKLVMLGDIALVKVTATLGSDWIGDAI